MGVRITINVNKFYQQNEAAFVERITLLITGKDKYFVKDQGYKYQLGVSNDWWIDRLNDTTYLIASRYSGISDMLCLKSTIIHLLYLEDFNKLPNEIAG